VPTKVFGQTLGSAAALGVAAAALGGGSLLATALGTRLRIRRPVLVQAGAAVLTTAAALFALIHFSLLSMALLCLIASAGAGLAKLALDASIQERIPEQVRASAFAHSETLLMIAWVLGGAVGLIPFSGRIGAGIAAGVMALTSVRAVMLAGALRKEKLRGAAHADDPAPAEQHPPATVDLSAATRRQPSPGRPRWTRMRSAKAETAREQAHTETLHPQSPESTTRVLPREEDDTDAGSPGYHLYRPSGRPVADGEDE